MAVIYAFGDSITYGAWDISDSGWAARMRRYVDDLQLKNPDLYYLFYNLGIPGETTTGLVKRFQTETEARLREERGEENVFIFAFGANDCAFSVKDNSFKVSKDDLRSNLQGILDKAKTLSTKILMLNITPVLEEVYNALVLEKGKVRMNKDIDAYNEILKDLAGANSIPLVDVNSVFVKAGPEKLFCEDGLHPNEEGHRLMFETVKPVLETFL